MVGLLANRTFRHLFMAQIVALLGTGLATVALALLAYDLAPEKAGLILGGIFTIKMVAYVTLSPFAGVLAGRMSRRPLLVTLDALRAVAALCLPFVSEIWQVFALIFLLQAATALFTPTFQATIPDILPDEDDYTRALSLSRLAYDIESIASPALAAALLMLVTFDVLFFGTVLGFLASAALVLSVALPSSVPTEFRRISDAATRGLRLYFATPRLRGLLALNFAAAASGALVLVDTVVLVRTGLARDAASVGIALAAFGVGSMVAALALPRMLDGRKDRPVMLAGGILLFVTLAAFGAFTQIAGLSWPVLLATWTCLGLGYSAILTPSGRLLRRSAAPKDRPAIYAAQFALSHACWLVTYPLAGWLLTSGGLALAVSGLGTLALAGVVTALRIWPRESG